MVVFREFLWSLVPIIGVTMDKVIEKIVRFAIGAFRSETIRLNGVLVVVWAALVDSGIITQIVESNPAVLGYLLTAQSVLNMILRAKTDKPLSDR